eukprot:TRINITY_DN12677_c0_g1_i1.p1 TRINITY_DN12677_c0_g1~~TRINITY_DN12677_c0_g1_i1.p1  ORF type:complete len:492 (+),score=124.09 TRINITY_DN12677_c0_g1_i1:3-1478(+)
MSRKRTREDLEAEKASAAAAAAAAAPIPMHSNAFGLDAEAEQEAEESNPRAFSTVMPAEKYSVAADDYNSVPTYPPRAHFNDHHLRMRFSTKIICFEGCPNDPYHPSSMPIYQTATFVQPSASEYGPYDYTRSGNPTRTALETLVAGLEDAWAAFAFTSGMAALTAVTRLVNAGEEIVACSDLYGGMHRLLTKICARLGVELKFVDTSNIANLKEVLTSKTRLVHVETPSNPLMRISDLRAIAHAVHAVGGMLSVDSTMMSPFLMKPLTLGADIVIHSATKFLSGHADVMAGVVCVKEEKLAKDIAFIQNAEGTALAPFDCWLLLRSIKTLALRAERCQQNAQEVVRTLAHHPLVKKLYYAGDLVLSLKAEKDVHNIVATQESVALHMSQARGGGSVISFETGDVALSRRVVDACRLFKITVSFGSCNSLIEMPCVFSHASIPAEKRTLPADLIRLSIGIEDIHDIIHDLERAFRLASSDTIDVRSPLHSP